MIEKGVDQTGAHLEAFGVGDGVFRRLSFQINYSEHP